MSETDEHGKEQAYAIMESSMAKKKKIKTRMAAREWLVNGTACDWLVNI
jgi:hypothetical protein